MVVGKSATGKTASLRNLNDHHGVLYLNCEAAKSISFANQFRAVTVTDPYQVFSAFEEAENMSDAHTIVIDSITFLMDMFESIHVIPAADYRKMWGHYAQFFKGLFQQHIASSTKNVCVIAHTTDLYNEQELIRENRVKIKGSVMNQGVESYLGIVIAAKKVTLKTLKGFENPMLIITEEENELGFKYVFQTRLTKETMQETIRAPFGLWDKAHTYVDNDLQKVLDKINDFYA